MHLQSLLQFKEIFYTINFIYHKNKNRQVEKNIVSNYKMIGIKVSLVHYCEGFVPITIGTGCRSSLRRRFS